MQTYQQLDLINSAINKLPYQSELSDDWRPIDEWGGDCDSYATRKLLELHKAGWDLQTYNIRLAVCNTELQEAHAVLLVDFEGETYCLDNRYAKLKLKDMLPYQWVKEQVAGTPEWVAC